MSVSVCVRLCVFVCVCVCVCCMCACIQTCVEACGAAAGQCMGTHYLALFNLWSFLCDRHKRRESKFSFLIVSMRQEEKVGRVSSAL